MESQAAARKALFSHPELIDETSISKDILNAMLLKKTKLNLDNSSKTSENCHGHIKQQEHILPACTSLVSVNENHQNSPFGEARAFLASKQLTSPMQSSQNIGGQSHLRPISEISENFQTVFSNTFDYFNQVQSECLDDLLYTDKVVVVSAPTGSGKTVLFELAIIKSLQTFGLDTKVVYMAPVKALCAERYKDWSDKFSQFGMRITELTGDSENDDFQIVSQNNFIITTPEKWDAVSRRWRDKKQMARSIKLFLIDEVHLLNDKERGHVLEAVVSRMKTIGASPRYIAVSATIPNVDDIAHWLGGNESVFFKFGEDHRPVKLDKIVLGFPFYKGQSEFKFEMNLSYKLTNIIHDYSDSKPTLVFCNSRKATMYTCNTLAKNYCVRMTMEDRKQIVALSSNVVDVKLRGLLEKGIGFHHAGLEQVDRAVVEKLFSSGILPVLACTSTLAMGVNLPAHLVIIKSTQQMISGMFREYSESQILQMAGRAGRPQYDTSATVVIMTEESRRSHYQKLIGGTQLIESNLLQHLHEHLNAEVVLENIRTVGLAVEWMKASFLYVRVKKNPSHYSLPTGLSDEQIQKKMYEICFEALNSLADGDVGLINLEASNVSSTEYGRLMSRFYMAFDTMRRLATVKGHESIPDLLNIICTCKEFSDIILRTSEKAALNDLNSSKDKDGCVRFPLSGKIKEAKMKVNILLQASLGCLVVSDSGLAREMPRCVQLATRMSKCLLELTRNHKALKDKVNLLKSSLLLAKSLNCGIWDNSQFVLKQMDRIGIVLSKALVQSGFDSFQKISTASSATLEMAMNKFPPFGTYVRDFASQMPLYKLEIVQQGKIKNTATLQINIQVLNLEDYRKKGALIHGHRWFLVVEGNRNIALSTFKGSDSFLLSENSSWIRHIKICPEDCYQGKIMFSLISETISGVDVSSHFNPQFINQTTTNEDLSFGQSFTDERVESLPNGRRACKHNCSDKITCAHSCCKSGVAKKKSSFIDEVSEIANSYKQRNILGYFEHVPKKAKIGLYNESSTIYRRNRFDKSEASSKFVYNTNKKHYNACNVEPDFDILPHNGSFTEDSNTNDVSNVNLETNQLNKKYPWIFDAGNSTNDVKKHNPFVRNILGTDSVLKNSSKYFSSKASQTTQKEEKDLSDYFKIRKTPNVEMPYDKKIDNLSQHHRIVLKYQDLNIGYSVKSKSEKNHSKETKNDAKRTFSDIFSGMF